MINKLISKFGPNMVNEYYSNYATQLMLFDNKNNRVIKFDN